MTTDLYDISSYDYHLPRELIAQEPARPRSSSRLMVLLPDGGLDHRRFYELPEYLDEGDVLVMNNSRVIPARLPARKPTGGKAEVLLLRDMGNGEWEALCGGKNLRVGSYLHVGDIQVELKDHISEGRFIVRFPAPERAREAIARYGVPPMPPYIRKVIDNPEDYQTVYAEKEGSVAAPTAGLHFDEKVFASLERKGVSREFVTLHVGLGTFQDVKVSDIRKHRMEKEYYTIDPDTASRINAALEEGRRVFVVGTTTMRALESSARGGRVSELEGWADLFIHPGYEFRLSTAGMITNFHIPRSTLIMLVSAYAGYHRIMEAYRKAVEMKYRFYSFGDAMLVFRQGGDALSP